MTRRLTTEELLRHFRSPVSARDSKTVFSPGRNPKRTTHYLIPYRNGHRHAVVTYLKTPSQRVREYAVAYLAVEADEIPIVMSLMCEQGEEESGSVLMLDDGSMPSFCCSAGVIQQPPSSLVGLPGVESDRHYAGWDWMALVSPDDLPIQSPEPRTIATWLVNVSRGLDQFISGTMETLTAGDEFYPYIDIPM